MLNFRRKRTWLALLVVILALAAAAINLASGRSFDREVARWRAEGLPTSYAELDQWYRHVPAHENAALKVIEAGNLYISPALKRNPDEVEPGPPGQPLSEELGALAREHLEKNKETLEVLQEALELPSSRYPVELWRGFNAMVQHLSGLRNLALLLKWQALVDSAEGRRADAVKNIRLCFGLARTVREEPVLITELVRIAVVAINLKTLERVLSEHALEPQEIRALLADLEQAETDGMQAMYRAFVGERTNFAFLRRAGFAEFSALGGAGPGAASPNQIAGDTLFALYKASGLRQRDLRIYVQTINDFIRATTNSYPDAMRLAKIAKNNSNARLTNGLGRAAIMSRMLLPALNKALEKEGVTAARLRCARAALMLELERANGATLENPSMAALPRDPFTGEPLVFERREKGWFVKSEGATAIAATKTNPFLGIWVAR